MGGNHTQPTFILLGITDTPWAQAPLFGLFLLIYIITLAGNIGLMLLVWVSRSLHTPTYFFLTHLSLADVCYSTIISPKMLTDLLFGNKTISWAGCVTQFHHSALFAMAKCHLLASMAYERHVAICHPLLYVTVASPCACWQLVAWSYLVASLSVLIYTSCTFMGSFCGPHRVNHFFCDAGPMLRLACSDTRGSEATNFALVTANGLGTGVVILLSCGRVLHTVLGMRLVPDRARARCTCTSHLVSMSVFYGTLLFVYLQPASRHGSRDKVASVFSTVLSPMLNPFIYSLRNREVKAVLGKCRRRMLNCCWHQRSAAQGIRESRNALGWKGPTRSSGPTHHGQGHLPLDQAAPNPIQPSLDFFQGSRGSHSFSGQSMPVPHHSLREEFLPIIPSNPTRSLKPFPTVLPLCAFAEANHSSNVRDDPLK